MQLAKFSKLAVITKSITIRTHCTTEVEHNVKTVLLMLINCSVTIRIKKVTIASWHTVTITIREIMQSQQEEVYLTKAVIKAIKEKAKSGKEHCE